MSQYSDWARGGEEAEPSEVEWCGHHGRYRELCACRPCETCGERVRDQDFVCPCGAILHDDPRCRREHYEAEHEADEQAANGEV